MRSKKRRHTNPRHKHKKRTYKNKQIGGAQEYTSYFDLSNITLKEVTEIRERVGVEINEIRERAAAAERGRTVGQIRAESPERLARNTATLNVISLYRVFLDEVQRLKTIDEMNAKYFGDRIPPLGGQVQTFDTRGVAEEMLKQNDKPAEQRKDTLE